MKLVSLFVLAFVLASAPAHAKGKKAWKKRQPSSAELAGAPAKALFVALDGERSNEGDGVVSKSGDVACSMMKSNPPQYECSARDDESKVFSGDDAKAVFEFLSGTDEVRGAEGDDRYTSVTCFEKGTQEPFTYSCVKAPSGPKPSVR